VHTFESTYHPGDDPASRVWGRALVKPVGATVLPLMIAVTVSALQLGVVWPYVAWGLPAALGVATVWTRFRLGSLTAELRVQSGQVALRSVHDVLTGTPPEFEPLYDVRVTSRSLNLSLGWTALNLDARNWPEFEALKGALESARHGRDPRDEARETPRSPSFSPHSGREKRL
jgi:hypothetical protein